MVLFRSQNSSPELLRINSPVNESPSSDFESNDLFSQANFQRRRGDIAEASAIYSQLVTEAEGLPQQQAQEQLNAIQGTEGFTAARAEFLADTFFDQVMNPASLGAMVGAGLTYRVARFALLSSAVRLGMRSRIVQPAASLLAFNAEASLFPVYNRIGLMALGESVEWNSQLWTHEIPSSFLVLGGLKLSGFLGTRSLALASRSGFIGRGPVAHVLSRVVPQGAMYLGILAGHQAEEWAELRHETSRGQLMAESMVTLLHFNAMGRMIPHLAGPELASFERGLDFFSRRISAARVTPKQRRALVTALGLGLAHFFRPEYAQAQGLGESLQTYVHEISLPLRLLIAGGLVASSLFVARRTIRYARINLQALRSYTDPKELRVLSQMARPNRQDVPKLLANLARSNPDALLELSWLASQFGFRRTTLSIIADMDLSELISRAGEDPHTLETLMEFSQTVGGLARPDLLEQLGSITIKNNHPPQVQDIETINRLTRLARDFKNPQAREILEKISFRDLPESSFGDWRLIPTLNYLALMGNKWARSKIQSMNPEVFTGEISGEDAPNVLCQALFPMAMMGNKEASRVLRDMVPQDLSEFTETSQSLYYAFSILAEFGNRTGADVLSRWAEQDPHASLVLTRLANEGNKIAQNLAENLNPQTHLAQAAQDPFSFIALMELMEQNNQSAIQGLENHVRKYPGSISLIEKFPGIGDRIVTTPLGEIEEVSQGLSRKFAEKPQKERYEIIRRVWNKWHNLSVSRRNHYYTRDQGEVNNSYLPISFLKENLRFIPRRKRRGRG